MLILSRKLHETITVGENAEVQFTVLSISKGSVRIGITAPRQLPVHREEIYFKIKREERAHMRQDGFEDELYEGEGAEIFA